MKCSLFSGSKDSQLLLAHSVNGYFKTLGVCASQRNKSMPFSEETRSRFFAYKTYGYRAQVIYNAKSTGYRGSGRATQHRNISTFPIHIMNYVCIYIYLYVRIRWCTVHINLHYSIHSIIVYHCITYYAPYYLRINPPISSTVLLSTQCRRITTPYRMVAWSTAS